MDELICPRCRGTTFTELDCGPDSYEDDVTWTSSVCDTCGLWYSGWTDKWLVDCTSWQDEETAEEYQQPKPYATFTDNEHAQATYSVTTEQPGQGGFLLRARWGVW